MIRIAAAREQPTSGGTSVTCRTYSASASLSSGPRSSSCDDGKRAAVWPSIRITRLTMPTLRRLCSMKYDAAAGDMTNRLGHESDAARPSPGHAVAVKSGATPTYSGTGVEYGIDAGRPFGGIGAGTIATWPSEIEKFKTRNSAKCAHPWTVGLIVRCCANAANEARSASSMSAVGGMNRLVCPSARIAAKATTCPLGLCARKFAVDSGEMATR